MVKDPKHIVTPFAFEVHPDLLGLPLASPRRRLFALLLDLLIASILSALGAFFLATSASILFFWLAIRNRGKIWWKNILRFGAAAFVSILVFALTFNVTKGSDSSPATINFTPPSGESVSASTDQIDWAAFGQQMAALGADDSVDIEEELEKIAETIEEQLTDGALVSESGYHPALFDDEFILNLRSIGFALSNRDTLLVDSLLKEMAPVIAYNEIAQMDSEIDQLDDRIDDLEDENEELTEQAENPSFLRSLKATAEDFGLSVGWVGVYFVLCFALYQGQTLGKKALKLRVVRLNNKPIGLLYSFERFGGYAAGLATGLLGFFQIYWDANRQGIHDKIAATVVLDMRPKMIKKFEAERKEIISEENLLD